ncbi:MAG TPA: hypothetical protein VK716_01940 [Terracidiphilus sp.]|jgi:hypothetical protein|nr:hypothetical protein [Terracidiphilus sp.]
MTLLDAPKFDEARDRRNRTILFGGAALVAVLFIGGWLVSGMPVDWPWRWWTHFRGRMTANHFLDAVEQNDLQKAYGVWIHDPGWQQHPSSNAIYPFARFQQDWAPTSSANEYGAIKSHKVLAERMSGNVLVIGIRINGLQSHNLFLDYDPSAHTLGFSPVELYLGP